MYSIAYVAGKFARPNRSGGIYAINADGSNRGTQYATEYRPTVIDILKSDDKFVLVQYYSDRKGISYGKMNVYNGSILPTRLSSPGPNYGSFYVDNNEQVRMYFSAKNMNERTAYVRIGDKWEWKILHESKASGNEITPMGFSKDNNIFYYQKTHSDGPNSLNTYNFTTEEHREIVRDDNVDPWALISSPLDGSPFAVVFRDGFPRYHWLDKSNPYAVDLMSMQAAFPGTEVVNVSSTLNGEKSIYAVASDTHSSEFYLFDHKTKKAEHIAERMEWINPEQMAMMEPVKLKARDGLELEGFLTLPKNSTGKNLPLIVHPHGGPFDVNDGWGFYPEIQMLANRGYAVLQVNFRGSGNYGKAFMSKGYKQWGKAMQDDLTDATNWAISQGIADSKRICIYGASYGAYAALMGVAKEPNLYQCAVGNVGVYDLPDLVAYEAGQGGSSNPMQVFVDNTINSGDYESSPARVAGKIKVPVYLMAGSKDTTCPPEWTKAMNAALVRAGVDVKMHIYEGEMHGNVLVKNQVDFANRLLAFFDAHLKPTATVKSAATAPSN